MTFSPGRTWQRQFKHAQRALAPLPTLITRVNSAAIGGGSASSSATATVPDGTGIKAGDLLVVTAGSQTGHVTNGITVRDSSNLVNYPTVLETQLGSASSRWMQSFWYVTPIDIPDGATFTCTGYTGAANTEFVVDVFRGVHGPPSVGPLGNSNAFSTSSAAPALPSAPAGASLVITNCEDGSGTQSPSSPFVLGSNQTTGASIANAYILSADGASTYGSTWTLGTANTSAAQTFAFPPGVANGLFKPPAPPAIPGQTWLRQFKHRQTVPYLPSSVSATPVGLADSGTGTDAFSAGNVSVPLPAIPGQTWLRYFRHRQQALYTSTFSIPLADAGAGADTFSTAILNPPLPAVAGRTWLRQFKHRQAYPYLPVQVNVNAIGLSDSGTGLDTFSAAVINPPLPAVPGRTWLRNFKHRQLPLYTSTFSEDFADSGSGTDTLAPGIATAYPFPPAVPGRTWQRQFKHVQQALYTSTYSRDLADSGTGTDALTPGPVFSNPLFPATPGRTWLRQFKHTQTYPYLPAPANTFNIGLADSGTGADTFAASITTTLPLTLRAGQTWIRRFKHRQAPLYSSTFSEDFADSGAGTDTLAITSGVPLSDSGTGTDTLSPGILNPPLPAVFGKTWVRQFKHRQAPLYTSTISKDLADSGSGADVLGVTITAVLPAPLYLNPGRTWRRRFKHRQAPLYGSVITPVVAFFSTDLPFTHWSLGKPFAHWDTGLPVTHWQPGQAFTHWDTDLPYTGWQPGKIFSQ